MFDVCNLMFVLFSGFVIFFSKCLYG